MMIQDYERFVRTYPDAVSYFKDSEARFELYSLLRELKRIDQRSERAIWIRSHVRQARQAPCCQEPWFLDVLAREHGGIAKSLLVLMESIP